VDQAYRDGGDEDAVLHQGRTAVLRVHLQHRGTSGVTRGHLRR
jgi:hypothetical protein